MVIESKLLLIVEDMEEHPSVQLNLHLSLLVFLHKEKESKYKRTYSSLRLLNIRKIQY